MKVYNGNPISFEAETKAVVNDNQRINRQFCCTASIGNAKSFRYSLKVVFYPSPLVIGLLSGLGKVA
jgi:hypothetical protein